MIQNCGSLRFLSCFVVCWHATRLFVCTLIIYIEDGSSIKCTNKQKSHRNRKWPGRDFRSVTSRNENPIGVNSSTWRFFLSLHFMHFWRIASQPVMSHVCGFFFRVCGTCDKRNVQAKQWIKKKCNLEVKTMPWITIPRFSRPLERLNLYTYKRTCKLYLIAEQKKKTTKSHFSFRRVERKWCIFKQLENFTRNIGLWNSPYYRVTSSSIAPLSHGFRWECRVKYNLWTFGNGYCHVGNWSCSEACCWPIVCGEWQKLCSLRTWN